MILKKDQKEDLVRRVDFIGIQLKDLKKFSDLTWLIYNKDRDIQRNIERLAENVANASIDICKIILAGEDVEMPNSYRDIILKLGSCNILSEKLAKRIADYAQLRNILAHQYLEVKWERLKSFIKNADSDLKGFIRAISKKL